MNIRKTNKAITRRLATIENTLKRKLNAFYNSNIKDSIFPTTTLRQKYEGQIKNIIRKTVQDAYLHGSDLVTQQISDITSDFVPFISVTDVQNITLVTDKVSDQFWKTADRLHRRETEFIAKGGDLLPKPEFDTTAAIIGLSAFATFNAFNNAVISKINIVNNPNLILGEGDLSLQVTDLTQLRGQVMFLTQEDAAVDPEICEPLNRTVYDAGDFDIPEPPLHNHCRCRLVPVVSELDSEGTII